MKKEAIEKTIQMLLAYKDEDGNKPIAIAPPCLGEPSKLRIYAYGGDIGKIADGSQPHAKCRGLSKSYLKYLPDLREKKELEKLLEGYAGDEEKLWGHKRYLYLAIAAAKTRYGQKERRIENDILKRYMKRDTGRAWCVVDMEFYMGRGQGIPDLIVYDDTNHQFGLIELKYKNQSTNNMNKHFEDFRELCTDTKKRTAFNSIMQSRINILQYFNLVGFDMKDFHIDNPVWFGFLFVDGNEKKSQQIVEKMKNELSQELGWDMCRFCYVKDITALDKCGLSFADMKTVEQFTKKI